MIANFDFKIDGSRRTNTQTHRPNGAAIVYSPIRQLLKLQPVALFESTFLPIILSFVHFCFYLKKNHFFHHTVNFEYKKETFTRQFSAKSTSNIIEMIFNSDIVSYF